MAGKNNRLGSGEISNMLISTRPQPTTTDPYRKPGTKHIFEAWDWTFCLWREKIIGWGREKYQTC